MLITNLLIASGVAYAGVKTIVQRKPAPSASTAVAHTVATDIAATIADPVGAPGLAQRRYRAVAATSVCLALGGLLFPVLTLASVPLAVYSAVPILEAGCQSLYAEGRLRPSVINSVLIGSLLVTDHYLPAATLTWLHHVFQQIGQHVRAVGEQVTSELNNEVGDLLRQAMGSAPRNVWVVNDTVEMKVPFAQVKVGDVVVVSRGEFVPVDGVIVAGTATASLILLTHNTTSVTLAVGDKVYTTTFVTEGRISVRVEAIRLRSNMESA